MARKYTEEFKRDAVIYTREHPELTNREAAKNLGVPYDTLYGWISQYRRAERPEAYDEAGRQTEEEKEIIRLRRELRDAKDALEILKKAISILGD